MHLHELGARYRRGGMSLSQLDGSTISIGGHTPNAGLVNVARSSERYGSWERVPVGGALESVASNSYR